jgi:hypothetical protein
MPVMCLLVFVAQALLPVPVFFRSESAGFAREGSLFHALVVRYVIL